MIFEIHAIADADCTQINDEILAATDSYQEAKQLAAKHSAGIYGAAILNTMTGEVNYGLEPRKGGEWQLSTIRNIAQEK